MPVRMELSRILIRELNDYQLIELREVGAEEPGGTPGKGGAGAGGLGASDSGEQNGHLRSFPIVIGLPEAQAIERRLKGTPIRRPQTHDLLANVIEQMGGTLLSITINDLSDHTFFATLDVRNGEGEVIHIDSRPSDAIALGVAGGVPIYVAEHVLDGAAADENQ